jgi:hypothetical protein
VPQKRDVVDALALNAKTLPYATARCARLNEAVYNIDIYDLHDFTMILQ